MHRYQRMGLAVAAGLTALFSLVFARDIEWSLRYLGAPSQKAERRLTSPLPPCPKCNVLLVSLDTLRGDRMGFLGSNRGLTPNLDKIAAKSVVFTHAYTNAFYTTPSHMTVFTSLYPATHQVFGKDMKLIRTPRSKGEAHVLDPKYKTLAQVLQENGYHTYWNAPLRLKFFEFKEGFSRGFENFHQSPFDRGLYFERKGPVQFRAESLEPLKTAKQPVFLFLHSYITHHPYIWRDDPKDVEHAAIPYLRDRLLSAFRDQISTDPENLGHMLTSNFPLSSVAEDRLMRACSNYKDMRECFTLSSEDRFWHAIGQFQVRMSKAAFHSTPLTEDMESQLELYRKAYDRGVAFEDKEVGEFWKSLEATGALDHTIVVIMSDHGEELYDNGEPSHSSFYEHTAHIPLLIYHPKVKQPIQVDQLVSLVDVMPTILSVLQIESPKQTQGSVPWESSGDAVFGYALGNDYVREREWKLMRLYNGQEELYYLPLDPTEHQNLIDYHNPWVLAAYRRLSERRRQWELEQAL